MQVQYEGQEWMEGERKRRSCLGLFQLFAPPQMPGIILVSSVITTKLKILTLLIGV
jgi:hypothetical protein